jgi:hypothetical protein
MIADDVTLSTRGCSKSWVIRVDTGYVEGRNVLGKPSISFSANCDAGEHSKTAGFATGKCDVFVANPASNVRLVGVYLGTFRVDVFTTELGLPQFVIALCR